MSNVTDAAFRFIVAKYGKPDVTWTEFVSCDGLQSKGQERLLIDLKYSSKERPIVAQIFGSKPINFYKTAKLLKKLKFDGIDINMGCPDRNVEKQCAGAAMMKNHKLAEECIKETQRGAGKLPISVKTRIGFNKNELDTWLPALLETDLAAITIHCRTRKEMSDVPARWEHVAEAVKLRDKYNPKTLILGNGDIVNIADANKKICDTGADGVMIGRGIFGNPWLFKNCHSLASSAPSPFRGGAGGGVYSPSVKEKLLVMAEHTHLFEKLLTDYKSFSIMKKHFKAYVNGFNGAKELRIKLMATKSAKEVEDLIKKHLANCHSKA